MLISKVNAHHEELLTEFARVRIARGFNRGKGDSAPILCREYLQFLECNGCDLVSNSHVFHYRKFCDYLKGRRKLRGKGFLSQAHQQHIRYAVHSFYEFMMDAGHLDSSPVTGSLFQHPEKKDKPVLNRKQIQLLFAEAKDWPEKVILALAYGCGLRRSEIERLQIPDYSPSSSMLTVREGKFYKSRVVPVSNKINGILSEYFNEHRLKSDVKHSAFLIDSYGDHITGDECYTIIRSLAKRSEKFSGSIGLHVLRNSIAVHMLDKGADFEFVKRFLGHALIDTTMLYTTRRRKRISLNRRIHAINKSA